MSKLTYDEQAKQLAIAIDIAVISFKKYSPKNWYETTIQQIGKTYLTWKSELKNSEPKYKNLKSLEFRINEVLTYFQESSGETVNYFWQQVNNEGLMFKRENKLSKILKRKKLKIKLNTTLLLMY